MSKRYSVKSTDSRTEWTVTLEPGEQAPLDVSVLVVLDPLGNRWGFNSVSTQRLLDLLLEHEADIRAHAARAMPLLTDVSAPLVDR